MTLIMLISFFSLQTSRLPAELAGVWEGRQHDLPAITIEIRDSNNQLSGTAVFAFMTNTTGTWKVERTTSTKMIDPKFNKGTLSFKVSHAGAHPGVSGPDDPPVPFEMTITGKGEAQLTSNYQGQSSAIKLIRRP